MRNPYAENIYADGTGNKIMSYLVYLLKYRVAFKVFLSKYGDGEIIRSSEKMWWYEVADLNSVSP